MYTEAGRGRIIGAGTTELGKTPRHVPLLSLLHFLRHRAGPVRLYEVHKAALPPYTAAYKCCVMSSCRGLRCSEGWLRGHDPNPGMGEVEAKPLNWVGAYPTTAGPMDPTGRDGQGSTRRDGFGSKIGEICGRIGCWGRTCAGGCRPRGLEGASWVEKWDDAMIAGRWRGWKK